MQFSVIVEGPVEGEPCSEDALLELERFLRASEIPSDVIQALKKGQPQILKNQLTYEQAVSISDRLMDLGLESIIDPPTKPEAREKKSNVTAIKPSNPSVKRPTQNNGNQRSNQNQSTASLKPTLAVVPNNKTASKSGQRPTMATIDSKPTTKQVRQAQPSSQSGQGKARPTNKSGSATKVTATPKPTPKAQVSRSLNDSKAKPANTALSKAAAEVKALFNLPKGGAVQISLPAFARSKLILVSFVCLAIPTIYVAIWLTIMYLATSLAMGLFSALSNFSLLLAVTAASVPAIVFIALFLLTNLPLLPTKKKIGANLVLRAKDEPKLFMLVTAIGKVLNAPAPTSLNLDASSHINAQQESSIADFFRLNQPLDDDIKLSIGAVLVQSLSIRDFCSMVAKEIGVYAHPQLRRPQWIIQHGMQRLSQLKTPSPNFQFTLRRLNDKTTLSIFRKTLAFISTLSEKLQGMACSYFDRADALVKICFGAVGSISTQYQSAVLGQYDANELIETLIHIEANYDLAIEELLANNPKPRLAENLPHYSQHLFEKNDGPASIGKPESKQGVVVSTQAVRSLIDDFDTYANTITRQYYQSRGLDLADHELCSLKNLFQKEVKDQKFIQASVDYFSTWQHPLQFWRIPAENLLPNAQSSDAIINRLNNCIARVRYVSPDRQSSLQRHDKLLQQCAELKAAKKIIASGNSFQYQHCSESAQSLDRDLATRKAQITELQDELRQQNAIMGERLALGLLLDKQHKGFSAKLFQALSVCHGISDKAIILASAIEELSHILRHKPKNQVQQYQLYTRELVELIRDTEKSVRRKLLQCPYDIIDRRYPNMAQFINAQQPEPDNLNISREQLFIKRSKDTLAAINWAYKQINQRAAFIAAAMEKEFGVDTVKRMEGISE